MNKLRLVLFEECNRSCEGCCNHDWDLEALPVNKNFKDYETIMLTGGEPMLKPDLIIDTVRQIRAESNAKIILYTAKSKRAFDLIAMLHILDGITLTLHEPYDAQPFADLNDLLLRMNITDKSLRVNIFRGIDISGIDTRLWKVVDDKVWIKDCPAPQGEVIKRLWN